MSIVERLPGGWIISHEDYLKSLYNGRGLQVKNIFDINTPFRMDLEAKKIADCLRDNKEIRKKKKKKKTSSEENIQVKNIQDFLERTQLQSKDQIPDPDLIEENNRPVRSLVRKLEENSYDFTNLIPLDSESVGQNDNHFVIPENSRFVLNNISSEVLRNLNSKFDIILMDPPWENKHVKRERQRGKGYETLPNDFISSLPIEELLNDHGIVFIWCTHSERHKQAILDWFNRWHIKLLATWSWLKVTRMGEPVVDMKSGHKLPFELLYIGGKQDINIPQDMIICSVPSAFQSHKPPLTEVIKEVFQNKYTKCLELFGRYLLPHWTTVGNECLKFQQKHFFTMVENDSIDYQQVT